MKHLIVGVFLMGMALAIGGCATEPEPGAPQLISPDDVWEGNLSFHSFIWTSVKYADCYALQIASDDEFKSTAFVDSTIQDTFFKVVADTFKTDSVYYWRVAASNENGWSKWSEPACFSRAEKDLLISPEAGEIITKEPPIFIWLSHPDAVSYVIRICRDSFSIYNTVLEDTINDTTYQLPEEIFWRDYNYTDTFVWAVSVQCTTGSFLWTTPHSFTSRVDPYALTYYALGPGYEWTYEGHYLRFDIERGCKDSTLLQDSTYTFTVSVVEHSKSDNEWSFRLEGYPYFRDQSPSIEIWGDSSRIGMGGYSSIVYLFQPDTFYNTWVYWYGFNYLCAEYLGDTLHTEFGSEDTLGGDYSSGKSWTNRLKDVGVVTQRAERTWIFNKDDGGYHIIQAETLVSFTTPEGQVWPPTD
ncbi:hypothetical protein JXM67_14210 [candidate division WOR-3 bacterium]|nr:hypothetical protein [candidate division WOR-3 bacterium]